MEIMRSPLFLYTVLLLSSSCGDDNATSISEKVIPDKAIPEKVVPIDGEYEATVTFVVNECGPIAKALENEKGGSFRTEDSGIVTMFLGDNSVTSLTKESDVKLRYSKTGTLQQDNVVTMSRASTSVGDWSGEYFVRTYNSATDFCDDKAEIKFSRK